MRLHSIKPAAGAGRNRMRVGRGIGSGKGKTAGQGQKGQKARGTRKKLGFQGGQMPLQRRLPKRGFISLTRKDIAEVRLSALAGLPGDAIDILILKQAGIVPGSAMAAKVILSGKIERAVKLQGVAVTKGAKAAIEAVGGSVE